MDRFTFRHGGSDAEHLFEGHDDSRRTIANMGQNPWWQPSDDDLGWDDPLPAVVELAPDYGAELPLWGAGFGNISWQFTKLSPWLLDRLAAWQQEFDANFHWESGWRSAEIRSRWASQADDLAADVRAELGTRAELVVRLWPLVTEE